MRFITAALVVLVLALTANCAKMTPLQSHLLTPPPVVGNRFLGMVLKFLYGVDGSVPISHYKSAARAIIKVAAADGQYSEQEKLAFVTLFRTAGTPDALIAEFGKIDPKTIDLAKELKQQKGDHQIALRHIVFAATYISAADSFHEKEREAVLNVAKELGVPEDAANGIISGTLKENEGRLERLKFMGNQDFSK
jgi:tellurite resistance protein